MTALQLWVVTSKHTNPNDFYVKVDGSEFYTAYWVANTQSATDAEASVMEAADELDLGEVEIVGIACFTGQAFSEVSGVDGAIHAAAEKHKNSREAQLAAWVSSQGGKW